MLFNGAVYFPHMFLGADWSFSAFPREATERG